VLIEKNTLSSLGSGCQHLKVYRGNVKD